MFGQTSAHAEERLARRIGGHTNVDQNALRRVAQRIADQNRDRDIAILLDSLDQNARDGRSSHYKGSNGNRVVAIARQGVVRTVMLRRACQPFTPEAFGVDACVVAE